MEQYNYMPIGTVVSYAGATTPIGWLLCDGRTIEEHEYPDLYRVLGSGVLPDLRGEFVRGLDNGRGLDGGRVLGSEQGDAIRNITGTFQRVYGEAHSSEGYKTGAFYGVKTSGKTTSAAWEADRESIGFNASRVVPTAEENRPKNVALNYIIKAFNTTTDTETLPIQMAKALNNKIENNYNDQLDATVDIVGKEFYDYIQNPGEKTAGKIYRDRLQKGIFRCLKTTTSVLNTSEFYESISNNDLGNRLYNLSCHGTVLNLRSDVKLASGNLYKTGNITSTFIEFTVPSIIEIPSNGTRISFFKLPENFRPMLNTKVFAHPVKVRTSQTSDNFVIEFNVAPDGEITLAGFAGDKFTQLKPNIYYQINGTWGL